VTNTEQQSIFIIGAGQAGCEWRLDCASKVASPIVLVGDEAHPP
jgi:hypothetical protein